MHRVLPRSQASPTSLPESSMHLPPRHKERLGSLQSASVLHVGSTHLFSELHSVRMASLQSALVVHSTGFSWHLLSLHSSLSPQSVSAVQDFAWHLPSLHSGLAVSLQSLLLSHSGLGTHLPSMSHFSLFLQSPSAWHSTAGVAWHFADEGLQYHPPRQSLLVVHLMSAHLPEVHFWALLEQSLLNSHSGLGSPAHDTNKKPKHSPNPKHNAAVFFNIQVSLPFFPNKHERWLLSEGAATILNCTTISSL